MKRSLEGTTILVTGASQGIGAAIAREMARRGAGLILTARNEKRLQDVRDACEHSERHRVLVGDMTQLADVERIVQVIRSGGTLDGVVQNAGGILYETLMESQEADDRELFELNFFSIVRLTRRLVPLLEKGRRPTLLIMSSAASWRSLPLWSSYCASKAALSSWAEGIRLELKPRGIQVVVVYPGVTQTGLSQNSKSSGAKPFATNEGKGMSPEKVAARAVDAYVSGQRDDFMGWFNRIYRMASFAVPKALDRYFEAYYRRKGWLP